MHVSVPHLPTLPRAFTAAFMALLATFGLLLWSPLAQALEDLLGPEQAFRFSAQARAPGMLEARLQIAPGYFLYHDKFRFSADQGVKLGTPVLPPPRVEQNPYKGEVKVYRGDLRIQIPVDAQGVPRFTLTAGYQGCADAGVCYPPQTVTVNIRPVAAAAPAAAAAPTQVQSPDVLERLKGLAGNFGMGEPDILPPEEAFKLSALALADGRIEVRFDIVKNYYLYRDKIAVKVLQPAGVNVTHLALPPGRIKDDPYFGRTAVYEQPVRVGVTLANLPAGTQRVKLLVEHQGCAEAGICYPPQETELWVNLLAPAGAAAPGAAPPAALAPPAGNLAAAEPVEDASETSRIARILAGDSFWVVLLTFFGFGLLLALTPCVFPMIPILSSIIAGRGQHITKTKGFALSLAYVLGMATTYAIIGVIAGLSGTLISQALQTPWALGIGAAIFVALALSMFGFYELQLPGSLQSRLTEATNRVPGGRFSGVFAMGVLSALILGPCVAAPLAGALLYISQTGDVVLGGASLFVLALGMGVPLLLVGISAGALLPKAGAWMEGVKKFFGVTMLAMAIWLISSLIPAVVTMTLWAALLIISAMYLHAMDPLAPNVRGYARFWKGVGVILLLSGVALLIGALGGSRDVLQPLAVFQGGGGAQAKATLAFKPVRNLAELDAAVAAAAAEGKPVMLDFYADWCVSCKELERFTFTDPRVQARLADVVLLKADVTRNTADDKAMLARFKLFGPPGIIFFDASGRELPFRVVGFEEPEKFLASLDQALP